MLSRFLIAFPRRSRRLFVFAICTLAILSRMTVAEEPQSGKVAPRKIVLIAGKKSHGPEGNGIHDYPWSAKLLKVMLDNSNIRDQVRVEYHRDGWPRDEKTLDDASAIVIISDGRDGDLYEEALHLESDQRVASQRSAAAPTVRCWRSSDKDSPAPHAFPKSTKSAANSSRSIRRWLNWRRATCAWS